MHVAHLCLNLVPLQWRTLILVYILHPLLLLEEPLRSVVFDSFFQKCGQHTCERLAAVKKYGMAPVCITHAHTPRHRASQANRFQHTLVTRHYAFLSFSCSFAPHMHLCVCGLCVCPCVRAHAFLLPSGSSKIGKPPYTDNFQDSCRGDPSQPSFVLYPPLPRGWELLQRGIMSHYFDSREP